MLNIEEDEDDPFKDFNDKEQEIVRIYKEQTNLLEMLQSLNFYKRFIGSVEITRNNNLYKVYFDYPLEANFLT